MKLNAPLSLTEHSNNKLLIVGSGAIGLLWYSHFYLHVKESINCFLYQSPNKKKIHDVFHFTSLKNKTSAIRSSVITNNSHNSQSQKIDIILVCVKSYQLNQAIKDVHRFISPTTIIIITHNGLGALNNDAAKLIANNITLNLLTTHGCLKQLNNEVIHTGEGISHLGIKFGQPDNVIASRITEQLNTVLPEVVWCDDILTKQWLKLAINCVINPLTAIFDITNGEVAQKRFDETINALIDEIVVIAKEQQINLNAVQLKENVLLVAKKTKNNSSSMRCDVKQKRPTEVEYINGYIHRLGQELNIPTPKNTELYHQVLAL